jgi:putative spermidine/putrescine transport system ATP-binding protein
MNARPPVADAVRVEGLSMRYGSIEVVKGIDLSVGAGEIVSLLGPSGCGKTTTLRAIAGFAEPHSGAVRIHGDDVTFVPPNRRDIGMVFQGYALFPHLSVFDNVAYGLRMRRLPRAEITLRVGRALDLVKLSAFADRRPKQLSGGQQQRVAIARALVIEPRVLLLDEPLSNLDAKLRHEMRLELRRLLKQAHCATLFVTHDQEEAIVLSDRIVLMNDGRIEQQGTPREMYNRPASLFAASFLGQANFLHGTVRALTPDGLAEVALEGQALVGQACDGLRPGMAATLVVKCERVRLLAPDAQSANRITARFDLAGFLGANVQLQCTLGEQRVVAMLPAGEDAVLPPEPGAPVALGWAAADALVFRADS